MILFQWLVAPLFALSAVICLVQALRRRMARRSGLFWALIWSLAALMVLIPELSTRLARAFGIGRGADFVLYLAVIVLFYLSLAHYLRARRLEVQLTELVRLRSLGLARKGAGGVQQDEVTGEQGSH